MEFSGVLILIIIFYAMIMFFDYFFKSCQMLPYYDFLKSTGITIKFFHLQIHSTSFNRIVTKSIIKLPNIYKNSFKFGFYVTMFVLFPISLCLMIFSLFSSSTSQQQTNLLASSSSGSNNLAIETEDIAHLEILLPGVNLPLNQIFYYILSLLICSVVHEAGKNLLLALKEIDINQIN